jgi:N utilization substance protein B
MIKQNKLNREKVSKAVSRLYSVQALFQMESGNLSVEQVQSEFSIYRDQENIEFSNFGRADLSLFKQILDGAIKNQNLIDQLITSLLKDGWEFSRIDPTLRSIFRAASSELLLGTPPKVVINEFLEIAKAFFPKGQECKLVNGILDSLAKILTKTETISDKIIN